MHMRMAVDALSGSCPPMFFTSGFTVVTGSRQRRMTRKPIAAFQNPTTVQGKVTANRAINTSAPTLRGGTAIQASHRSPAIVATTTRAKTARRDARFRASTAARSGRAVDRSDISTFPLVLSFGYSLAPNAKSKLESARQLRGSEDGDRKSTRL